MLQRGITAIQFFHLILGEIADPHLAGFGDLSLHRGKLRREQTGKSGLAIAVAPQQRQPIIRVQPQVQPLQDGRAFGVADARHIQRHQRWAKRIWIGKVKRQSRVFCHRRNGLHLSKRLGAGLSLFRRARPCAVAGNIILQFRALGILRGFGRRQLRGALGPLPFKSIIAAGVERRLPIFEVEDMVHHIVQKIPLMADHHHHAGIAFQEAFQPQGRFQIQMV